MKPVFFFFVILLVSAFAVRSWSDDSWHFNHVKAANPFFWDFKYFNFHSDEIDGSVTYFTVTPQFTKRIFMSASVYTKSQTHVLLKSFPIKCAKVAANGPDMDLCGQAGISTLDATHYRINAQGAPIQWSLDVNAAETHDGDPTFIELDATLPLSLDRLFFKWSMTWNPVWPESKVSGSVSLGATTLTLNDAPGYHDENWGTWLPPKQPFRWLHFSGVNQEGRRVDFLLGEFPKNTVDQKGGVALNFPDSKETTFFSQYTFQVDETQRARVTESNLKAFEKVDVFDPTVVAASSNHFIPSRLSIFDSQGDFKLEGMVLTYSDVSPQLPRIAAGAIPSFAIDESVLDVKLTYLDHGKAEAAQGKGELMLVQPLE